MSASRLRAGRLGLTVSPIAVYSMRSGALMLPTTARLLWDADPDSEVGKIAAGKSFLHPGRHLDGGVAQRDRGAQRPARMILSARCAELGHDRIADELVNRAAFLLDDRAGRSQPAVQHLYHFLRAESLGDRREAADVGKRTVMRTASPPSAGVSSLSRSLATTSFETYRGTSAARGRDPVRRW